MRAVYFATLNLTLAKRMGKVIRASPMGLAMWRLHAEKEEHFDWVD